MRRREESYRVMVRLSRCMIVVLMATATSACLGPSRTLLLHHPAAPAKEEAERAQAGYSRESNSSTAPGEEAPPFDFSHAMVERYVLRFQKDLRGFMAGSLERAQWYLPAVKGLLAERGLPAELAYVPIIESGYRCNAVSSSGAVGPWQFMRPTGRRYGLVINRTKDERRDPIRSTRAAARYLSDLYRRFGDWQLALAAYNGGEGQVEAALKRSGARSFWKLAPYLPAETRQFVPRVLAAARIGKSPERYGFTPPPAPICASPRLQQAEPGPAVGGCLAYTVVRGDTLAAIARRYRVSVGALQAHNRIGNPRRLKPGRILLIPRGS